jgi:hypothetical protein
MREAISCYFKIIFAHVKNFRILSGIQATLIYKGRECILKTICKMAAIIYFLAEIA